MADHAVVVLAAVVQISVLHLILAPAEIGVHLLAAFAGRLLILFPTIPFVFWFLFWLGGLYVFIWWGSVLFAALRFVRSFKWSCVAFGLVHVTVADLYLAIFGFALEILSEDRVP